MKLQPYLENIESAASLARKLCISPVLISQWKAGYRPIPIERCTSIEKVTNGFVTRQELRPDDWALIWPELVTQQEVA